MLYSEKKLRKGLMRVKVETDEQRVIQSITITGDFFLLPEDALWKLEERLKGAKLERNEIIKKIEQVFEETEAIVVGSTPQEIAEVILEAREP
ncbi:MAG: lipoate protein ligase C-terminal domain-containing protein [Desulfurococcales archaeon]